MAHPYKTESKIIRIHDVGMFDTVQNIVAQTSNAVRYKVAQSAMS